MHFLPCYTKVWRYCSEGYFKALSLLKCVSMRSAERDIKWGSFNVNCLQGTDRWHRRSDTVEAAGKVTKWMPQTLSVKHKLIKAVFILLRLESTPDQSRFPGFMLSVFSVHLETVAGWCMFCWLRQPCFCNSLLRLIVSASGDDCIVLWQSLKMQCAIAWQQSSWWNFVFRFLDKTKAGRFGTFFQFLKCFLSDFL